MLRGGGGGDAWWWWGMAVRHVWMLVVARAMREIWAAAHSETHVPVRFAD